MFGSGAVMSLEAKLGVVVVVVTDLLGGDGYPPGPLSLDTGQKML